MRTKEFLCVSLLVLTTALNVVEAQGQELPISDKQNSGCLSRARSYEGQKEPIPTIILTKEGSILSVEVQNFNSNCATYDFAVSSEISEGSDGSPCSLSVIVNPILPNFAMACTCPFNVSFTIRDLEPNSFYLDCWWYKGQVELKEGEPFVVEYKTEVVDIDGLKYQLLKTTNQAKLIALIQWDDERKTLLIPSEIEYEGEKYTVNSINESFYLPNSNTTKIIIPKTVVDVFNNNPFRNCLSVESIEVEEGNPVLCSVDGVLFNKDKTTLIGYPAASPRESYIVPDGVTNIRSGAFVHNRFLRKLVIPEEVTSLGWHLFSDTKSLEALYIKGVLDSECMDVSLFDGMSTTVKVYVQPSEVDKFKAIYKGPVYPLPEQMDYYYYNGKKMPLTLNENKVVVSIPKDCDGISNRIRANVSVLSTIKDEVFDVFIISRSDFGKLNSQDFWEEDAKSVVLTSSYFTEADKEVFATPYLSVKLKKEGDADLLESYAEKYRLRNLGSFSQYLPLWYVLYLTPESEKSPLECANELHESGDFLHAIPDFAEVFDDRIEEIYLCRPFIEDGKVWKVGDEGSGNPVQMIRYYYFDGDTIIDGKTCKQMMCQQYVNPGIPYYDQIAQLNALSYVGAWYEENMKVYFYDEKTQSMTMKYDFPISPNDTLYLINDYQPFIIGPTQTGSIKGFKSVYRDIMICIDEGQNRKNTTWLWGVGGIDGPTINAYPETADHQQFLMSCTVGDEVIYLNDEYEDGATPAEARKNRFDFTHTIKTKPKARTRNGEEQSPYGEYNDHQLGIHLDPLDGTYQVCITDESGNAVYEKAINAGSIVGLNIDISAYAKGRYTVTVENSRESFTGEFEAQTTGIEELKNSRTKELKSIYNLQGQRLSSLQKGLNIVDGQKIYVK